MRGGEAASAAIAGLRKDTGPGLLGGLLSDAQLTEEDLR